MNWKWVAPFEKLTIETHLLPEETRGRLINAIAERRSKASDRFDRPFTGKLSGDRLMIRLNPSRYPNGFAPVFIGELTRIVGGTRISGRLRFNNTVFMILLSYTATIMCVVGVAVVAVSSSNATVKMHPLFPEIVIGFWLLLYGGAMGPFREGVRLTKSQLRELLDVPQVEET